MLAGSHHVIAFLQDSDDLILVFWEHLGKTVGLLHELTQLLLILDVLQHRGINR